MPDARNEGVEALEVHGFYDAGGGEWRERDDGTPSAKVAIGELKNCEGDAAGLGQRKHAPVDARW
jgi:hypothetical protein